MKALEKIYVPIACDKLHYHMTCPKNEFKESVEYTRTDAFIEKACNYWYKHNQEMIKRYGSKAILGCSEFTVNVKNFQEYMKGK